MIIRASRFVLYHKFEDLPVGLYTAAEAFTLAKQKIKDLNTNLIEANRDKKSAKAALEGAERQGKSQRQQLRQTKD